MNVLKFIGLLSVLLACGFWGIYKSNTLLKRNRSLSEIAISLGKLAQLVKSGTGERNRLFALSFKDDILSIQKGVPMLNCDGLLKEDTELFYKLLEEMGISDREREYKRIMLYKTLFEKQQKTAEDNANQLCKLYNSCGFLVGLSICIFLV